MGIGNRKKTIATAGASLALVAAMVGVGLTSPTAAAWAAPAAPGIEQVRQATPTPAPKPAPKPNRQDAQQQRGQNQQAYLNALAGRLGLTTDQLQEAMRQARIDLINQAVAEGRLTQERANQMIQAIQSGQRPNQPGQRGAHGQQGPGRRGPAGQGQMPPGGPRVVADVLGMTPEQLRAELQSGKSLAQIAEAKGVSRDTLKTKLLEAHKARVDAAVSAGRMTAEQAQQATARITANIDRILDMTPGQRRPQQAPGSGA